MTNQEKEHNLSVLVELKLFNEVRAMKESDLPDKSDEVEKVIKRFMEELPPYLSEIPDVENKVRSVLQRTEEVHEEQKKMREKERNQEEER